MKNNIILGEEQQKVVDAAEYGIGNVLLEARAGTGKTTAIIEAIKVIPETESVLLIAFNKSIIKANRKAVGDRKNTTVRTFHSLGENLISLYTGNSVIIEDTKYRKYIHDNISKLSYGDTNNMKKHIKAKYQDNLLKLLNFSRYNLAQSEKEIRKISEKHRMNLISNECEAVIKIMEWGQSITDVCDYTDLIWLPCELNMSHPFCKYDWVFVDEVQDSSPCQQKLFQICMKSNSRCFMVGDEYQCINEWCGSDRNAFKNLRKLPNTSVLSLTTSRRCAKSIIKSAQRLVPDIKAAPDAKEGISEIFVHLDEIKVGDMVTCRNNEPLMRLHAMYLKKGIPSYIIGKNVGHEIKTNVRNTEAKEISLDLKKDGLFPILYYNFIYEVELFASKKGLSFDEVVLDPSFRNSFDGIKSIEALAEGTDSVDELMKRVDEAFIDDDEFDERSDAKNYIKLVSIHRSKGLEAERVFSACCSLCPSKFAKTSEELKAEDNLLYVQMTRAKSYFAYIYESDLKPSLSWGSASDVKKEIYRIREAVEKLYGPIKIEKSTSKETKKTKVIEKEAVVKNDAPKKNKMKFNRFL